MKNHAAFIFFCICIFFASSVYAQIPRTISYQGFIADPSGNFIPNGAHSLTIRLYEQATGGTAIFEESQSVAVTKGVFSVQLGSVTPFPALVTFDRAYFLGVSVDGGAELVPRTVMSSVPYALHSGLSDNALHSIESDTALHAIESDNALHSINSDNAIHAEVSDTANHVRAGASGVVASVNNLSGDLTISGSGATTVTNTGNDLTITSVDTSNLRLPYSDSSGAVAISLDIKNTGTASAGKFSISNAVSSATVLQVAGKGLGSGISVQLTNTSNGARGIDVTQAGVGPGVFATSTGGNALWGITSSISAAGVIGDNTFGEAVVGRNRGGNGVGAVVGRNDSSGYGVRGFNTKAGIGVLGQAGISGGTGIAGRFENVNAANSSNVLEAKTNGTGRAGLFLNGGAATATFATLQVENLRTSSEAAWFRNSSASNTNSVLRLNQHPTATANFIDGQAWDGTNAAAQKFHINKSGTFVAGSDFAEAFPVEGKVEEYSPGDVMVMNEEGNRVVKCSSKYDRRVVGIYSERPAVLGAEKNGESRMDANEIPVAITGIVPTKVTTAGGAIQTGDLLTTSTVSGFAMKAKRHHREGTIVGKALEPLESGEGMIKVLVMLR